jgi:acyl carrier protein
MEYAIVIIVILIAAIMWGKIEDKNRDIEIVKMFKGRESLSPREFYEKYYGDRDISEYVVVNIIKILETTLETELSRLTPSDDLSENLRYLFEFDSMADVDIVESVESRFAIKISDTEAENINTINDLVLFVSSKANCT